MNFKLCATSLSHMKLFTELICSSIKFQISYHPLIPSNEVSQMIPKENRKQTLNSCCF